MIDLSTIPDCSELTFHTPSKVNLFLELLARRADGYHELEMLTAPVDFTDTLVLERTDQPEIQLDCQINRAIYDRAFDGSDPGSLTVPDDERNLAFRAAKLLQQQYNVPFGVNIRLVKNVPPQSGLGAGSSNAAFTLLGCARLWGLSLSEIELVAMGASLGADVPLFFYGSAVIARGIGDRITTIEPTAKLPAVLYRPPCGLSTKEVYRHSVIPPVPRRVDVLFAQIQQRNWDRVYPLFFNRLEESAQTLTPWVRRLRDAFIALNCRCCMLSGSGSTYFGIFDSAEQAARAAEQLNSQPGYIRQVEISL